MSTPTPTEYGMVISCFFGDDDRPKAPSPNQPFPVYFPEGFSEFPEAATPEEPVETPETTQVYGHVMVFDPASGDDGEWFFHRGDDTNGAWVNVKASALPTGAATEATLGTLATEATLSALNGKVTVDADNDGIKASHAGADDADIVRGSVTSADATTPETVVAANASYYYSLEEVHLTVLDAITVTLKVGSAVLWQFTGPGQDHFVSLYGLRLADTAGNEAVTVEADGAGDLTVHVAVRRLNAVAP